MSSSIISPPQPEQILKGLGKLWTSLGQEEKQKGKPTVLRACAMTLIVATDESDSGFSASQTISELMHEHPSRGIVLSVSEQAEKSIEARVLAQCWKPFGKAQQICCEQIEITIRPENWPRVGPTLVGLIAADLPVIFWCRHKAALGPSASQDQQAGLREILDIATKVIIDTQGEDARTSFALINQLRSPGRAVADLEWARMTSWRQPLSQIFDNPTRPNKFVDFGEIEIAHAENSPPSSALYVAGWLSAPSKAKVSFVKEAAHGPGVHRISLISASERIDFERTGSECMELRSSCGRQRSYSYTNAGEYTLMNEELSITGVDPSFNAAFAHAQDLLR